MNYSKFSILFVAALGLSGLTGLGASTPERARLIVLADMGNEPDEVQQILHLLMCANEVEIEGLLAVTGKYLHPERKEPYRQKLHPEFFTQLIDGYALVYIEGCRSHPVGANDRIGYHGVEQFIVQPVHPGTKNQTIPDYVKTVGAGRTSPLKSPLQALFRANQSPATQAQAVVELEKTLAAWKNHSATARERYKNPVRMKRVGDVDWEKAVIDLQNDIAIAREGRPAPSPRESTKKAK